ncbi:MAG: stage III sporulation protein AF [Clostridia bacterium]|nr:stage III sporulation protein AF [Clostridia bacterium]
MNAYFVSVMTAAVAVSAAEIIFPDGKTAKYVGYVAGIIILTVISAPLFAIFGDGGTDEAGGVTFPEYETYSGEAYSTLILETERILSEKIKSELDADDVTVTLRLSVDGDEYVLSVCSITVTLPVGREGEADGIILKYEDEYNCEVTVLYER